MTSSGRSATHKAAVLAPGLFVVLWSTGFIVARYGTKDAGPLTFLTIRTAIAALILYLLAQLMREDSLSREQIQSQWIVGAGIHAMYLGGVFVAIDHGLPSGVSALIAALHPVVTTVLGRVLLGEELTRRRILGVFLGTIGVVAVVVERGSASDGITAVALVAMTVAVFGMSGGTLYQRHSAVGIPLLRGTAWQYVATTVILGLAAIASEGWEFTVTRRSVLSMMWAVGVLSLAAILIMLWLLHRQAASQVSSLFFLTPALSTVEGAILFSEKLGALSVAGLVIAVIGVWLATSQKTISQLK